MENMIQVQTEKTLDAASLFAVSVLLMDVSRTIRSIQMIVAAILRYVTMCVSITHGLMRWIAPTALEQS